MRNIFDQYSQPENRLTHALACCLDEDANLLREFVEWVTAKSAPDEKLHVVEQSIPGQPGADEDGAGDSVPDAWIYSDNGWSLLIESKVQAPIVVDQLDRLDGGGIVADSPGGLPSLLEPGDVIGPASPLLEGGGIDPEGRFDDVEGAFVGFAFQNEATDTRHFGWARVTLPSVGDGVITAYAYEATPDTPITIPAPAGAGALCLAVGAALRRRR